MWSPTARSESDIAWPALVILVSAVTVIVRVQPSSVLSERLEPLMAVIVIDPNPPNPRMALPVLSLCVEGAFVALGATGAAGARRRSRCLGRGRGRAIARRRIG